jgi:glutaredoxin
MKNRGMMPLMKAALLFKTAYLALSLVAAGSLVFGTFVSAQAPAEEPVPVYMLGRDDCGFCNAQKDWFVEEGINYEYLNIVADETAADYFDALTAKHELTKVTPITVIGERVILGFNSGETSGQAIKAAIAAASESDIRTLDEHLEWAPQQDAILGGGGCSDIQCDIGTLATDASYTFDLPFLGIVDLKSFSLFSLSAILGVIDGFNPCAMWVLVTFLALLSQAGSRQRMIMLAGIFIVAQGIMYNLILNIWYKTWDFVALDQYVTPLVGFLALGGGVFFLWRWNKNRHQSQLVCDISDIETQSKTINKFQEIVSRPVTIASVLGILAIAFSVNIIEFACSIGIPQAYTKILDQHAHLL